jgi:hypothetical protein
MPVDEQVPESRYREQGNALVTSLTVVAGHGLVQIFDLLYCRPRVQMHHLVSMLSSQLNPP